MKRKKIYSMLVLGMAMSLVFAVPVSATGASSVTTSDPVEITNPDGSTTTTTTKPEQTDGDNKITGSTEVTVSPDGQTIQTVETTITENTATGEKTEEVKETDASGNVSTTTTKSEGGVIKDVELKDVVTSEDQLSEIMAEGIATTTEKEALDEVLKETLAVPDKLPDDLSETEKQDLDKAVNSLFNNLFGEHKKGGNNEKKLSVADADNKFGSLKISPVAPEVQFKANDAKNEIAKKAWGSELDVSKVALMSAANIELTEHDGSTPVQVTIPIDYNENASLTYFVMHYNKDGIWERLPATVSKKGLIVAVFDSFSPVYVVAVPQEEIERVEQLQKDNASNDSQGESGSNDDQGSSDDGSSSNPVNTANPAKDGATPAGASITPANPAVSPKTGE